MKIFRMLIFALCFTTANFLFGQGWTSPSDSLNKQRLYCIAASQGVLTCGSYSGLYFAWYANYRSGKFSWFDDSEEWMQMDKAGHATTSYVLADKLYQMNKWTGLSGRKALFASLAVSQSYQTLIEVQDGLSKGWGFSWWDVGANMLGGSVYTAQQLVWNEQRIKLKFSYSPSGLNQRSGLEGQRAIDLFGKNFTTQWLKDYNGQTYWLSMNLWSLTAKPFGFPRWLNLAFGYSANNMLGARSNTWEYWSLTSDINRPFVYTSSLQRQRQFILSLDVDFDKVPLPRSLMWLRPIARMVKFPFPALEWNSELGIVGRAFYF